MREKTNIGCVSLEDMDQDQASVKASGSSDQSLFSARKVRVLKYPLSAE